jgi:hypothetical protein
MGETAAAAGVVRRTVYGCAAGARRDERGREATAPLGPAEETLTASWHGAGAAPRSSFR